MTIVEVILASIFSSGFTVAILAYLGKSLLSQLLAKEIERYKSGLMADLESIKTSLNKELHAFSTQFSRVDQQRAIGIMEIHGLMCQIEQFVIWESGAAATTLICTSPENRTMESLNKAWEGIADLNQVLAFHSLLLDETIYANVLEWSKIMMKLISEIGNEVETLRKMQIDNDKQLQEREAKITKIIDKHMDQYIHRLGIIRKGLDSEFKKILGILS